MQLINAYRVRGHLIADLDPLGDEPSYHPELDPVTYGLTIWDLDREFLTGSLGEAIGEGGRKPVATLREILETLRADLLRQDRLRVHEHPGAGAEALAAAAHGAARPTTGRSTTRRALRILRNLIAAEEFEHFLHSRFVGPEALRAGRRRNRPRHPGRDPGARRRTTTCTKW